MFDFLKRYARQKVRETVQPGTFVPSQPMDAATLPQIAYDLNSSRRCASCERGGSTYWRNGSAGERNGVCRYVLSVACVRQAMFSRLGAGSQDRLSLRYVLRNGTYRGFDISSQKIDFLKTNFTMCDPSFQFEYADVKIRQQNPAGTLVATNLLFPYPTLRSTSCLRHRSSRTCRQTRAHTTSARPAAC